MEFPIRPPQPSDPSYERIPRYSLVEEVLTKHLRRERVAVLLETYRGGGKTLARQIAPLYRMPTVWLTNHSTQTYSTATFYQMLTRNSQVRSQNELYEWLCNQATDHGLLVVLFGTCGSEELLEEVASIVRSLHADRRFSFLVVGGERLLRLRSPERYSWFRLLPGSSFFDVPDLETPEIAELLHLSQLPAEQISVLHQATGGHPWLVHELICQGPASVEQANELVRYHLSMTHKAARHRDDPQACKVIRRLLENEEVAPLVNRRIRHEPSLYAESRLYFDGLLRWDESGKTQFRCPAVRLLLEEEMAK